MKNKKIVAGLFFLIVALIAIIAVVFGWVFEKKQDNFLGKKNQITDLQNQTEEKWESVILADIKDFTLAGTGDISKIERQSFEILDYFKASADVRNLEVVGLFESSSECGTNKSQDYFRNLLNNFSESDQGVRYRFFNNVSGELYTVTVIPNIPKYENLTKFKDDFGICYAGADAYPYQVSENKLLFISAFANYPSIKLN